MKTSFYLNKSKKHLLGRFLSQSISLLLFTTSIIIMPQAIATPTMISSATSYITNGFLNPTPIIIGTDFAPDNDKFDFTVDVGTTGLEFDSTAFISDSRMRFNFHGIAKAGVITIIANGSAFNTVDETSSNELVIVVVEPMMNQTITFSPLKSMIVGEKDQPLVVAASSGLEVTVSSNIPSVCTIDYEKIHAVSAGICSIKVTQSGDGQFNAAPDVTIKFTINPKPTPTPETTKQPEPEVEAVELGSMSYDPQNSNGGFKSISITNLEFNYSISLKLRIPTKATASKTIFLVSSDSSAKENATGYFTAKVIAVTADGIAVKKLKQPMEINIPSGASDALLYWSYDGERWYKLKEINSKTLPSNLHAGFYIDSDSRINILTDYLMLFGLRKPQLPLTILSPVTKLNALTTAALKTTGGSGNGALDFKTSTEEVCSITPQGIISGLSQGQCLVTASKAASNNFVDTKSAEFSLAITNEILPSKTPPAKDIFDTGLLTHSLTFMTENGLKTLEVGLCSIYANEQAEFLLGTKTKKGKLTWKKISTTTLDANGVGTFSIVTKLPKGGLVRVMVNGVIQMESDV